MSLYLIKLKPLGDFFFGGENTFGKSGKVKEARKNYLVKSNCFPQQTAVLGMLRKEVLIQENLYKDNFKDYTEEDKAKMKLAIGEKSFSISEDSDSVEYDFGKINAISPVFIIKDNDDIIIPLPKDQSHAYKIEKSTKYYNPFKLVNLSQNNKLRSNLRSNLRSKQLYQLETALENNNTENSSIKKGDKIGYDAKNGLEHGYVNINTKEILDSELSKDSADKYVFIPTERVGNQKNEFTTENREKGFYKLTSYKLNPAMEFAFVADLDVKLKNKLVNLGGLQSLFKMEVELIDEASSIDQWIDLKIENSVFVKDIFKNDPNKIIFIGDCFLGEKAYDYCDFSIVENIDFRNMVTSFTPKKYRTYGNFKCNFIEKGSVFFFEEDKKRKIDSIVNSYSYMRKIGYNYFVKGDTIDE